MFQEWLIMNEQKINHLYSRTEICSNSEITFHPLCGSVLGVKNVKNVCQDYLQMTKIVTSLAERINSFSHTRSGFLLF